MRTHVKNGQNASGSKFRDTTQTETSDMPYTVCNVGSFDGAHAVRGKAATSGTNAWQVEDVANRRTGRRATAERMSRHEWVAVV